MTERDDIQYLEDVRAVVEDRVLDKIGEDITKGHDTSRTFAEFRVQREVNTELTRLAMLPFEESFARND